jgi:hypothetical protein
MGKSNKEISNLSKQELIRNRKVRYSVKKYLEKELNIPEYTVDTDPEPKKWVENLTIYSLEPEKLKDLLDKYKSRKRSSRNMERGYSSNSSGGKRKTHKNKQEGVSGQKQFEVAPIGETGGSSDVQSSIINAKLTQLAGQQTENSRFEGNLEENYSLGSKVGGKRKRKTRKNKKI